MCGVRLTWSSRRQLTGGIALTPLTGSSLGSTIKLPAPSEARSTDGTLDAKLINLCARCDALQNQIGILHLRPAADMLVTQELAWEEAHDLLIKPIADQQEPLLKQICALRVTTLQGHAARAGTLLD